MSVMRPDLIMKSVIPVVMAGIIAIYGLVVAVLVANKRKYHNHFFNILVAQQNFCDFTAYSISCMPILVYIPVLSLETPKFDIETIVKGVVVESV